MKQTGKIKRKAAAARGLDRLKRFETRLAAAPAKSREHRALSAAIRIEARAYRKSLDVEQANAIHDPHPLPRLAKPRPRRP